MLKVKNEKVVLTAMKNGKIIKQTELHNRLTNMYLAYVLSIMFPDSMKASVFSGITLPTGADLITRAFSFAYLKFVDTQTVDDTDTTMSYNIQSISPTYNEFDKIKVGDNIKTLTVNYAFDLSTITNNSLFTGVGFGRDATEENNYLFSFIDLSSVNIYKNGTDEFYVARFDEITSNEKGLSGTDGSYLPLILNGNGNGDNWGELKTISLCFGLNGIGQRETYNIEDLTCVAGIDLTDNYAYVDITGFDDFHLEENILYPAIDLYPATDLYPTQDKEQFQSVIFTYNIWNSIPSIVDTQETYVNKEDLDISYEGEEIKIKLKCERGEY